MRKITNVNPVIASIAGSLFLIFIYFLILTAITKDWRHPWEQFLLYKYWMSALILGFGVQAGLFQFIRSGKHLAASQSKVTAGASAGVSGAAMIACCAHHGLEIIPFLGFSGASLFVTKYQVPIFVLGIFANLAGISLMTLMIKKRSCSLNPFRFQKLAK
ncbi:hypothetical protein HY439_03215 [Candidatus Microgenomates bacterium]|nr:hypothetical protein [Candidatus Microgenomates bacterium]